MTNFRVFRRFIAKAMFIQNIKKIVAFAALIAVSMTMGLSAARAGNTGFYIQNRVFSFFSYNVKLIHNNSIYPIQLWDYL